MSTTPGVDDEPPADDRLSELDDPPDLRNDLEEVHEEVWEGPSRRNVVGRNIVVLMGSQAITWSLALIITVAEPRFLGPNGVGQLQLGMAIWSIVNIVAELGTSTLLTLEFARDEHRARSLLRPVLRLRAMAEVLAAASVLGFITLAGYELETSVTVMLVGVGLFVMMVGEVARASLYGIQWMSATARADIVSKVVLVSVVVTTMALGGKAQAVAIATIVPSLVGTAMLWRSLQSRLRGNAARSEIVRAPHADNLFVLKHSSPYLLGSAIQVAYGAIDVIIISLVATVDEVGWYAAAAMLFGSLLFIPTTVTTSLFPALAQLHTEQPDAPQHLLSRAVRSSLLVAVPIGLGTVAIAEPLTLILLGEDFREAGPVLALYGVVMIIMFHTILFGRYAFATGRHRFFNTIMAVVTVLTVPLDLILVPIMHDRFDNGALGGALAYIITESIILVASVVYLVPSMIDRSFVIRVVKTLAAGGTMLAVTWQVRDQFLAVPIIVGVATYGVAVLTLRVLDDEEREMIGRLLQKISGRLPRRRPSGDHHETENGS